MSIEGNFERALITAIINEKATKDVVKHKITQAFFEGVQERSAFLWLLEYYRNPRYTDTPSWEVFQDTWPDFVPEESSDSVVALCDKLREKKLYSDLAAELAQVAKVGIGDPLSGLTELRKAAARLTSTHTVDESVTLVDHLEGIRAEYFRMKRGEDKLKGRPYPWDELNDATQGCQDGQLIVIYGRPKSLKTWAALRTISNFAAFGAQPLIYSQELSDVELARRYVALSSHIDYRAFQRGELDEATEHDFFEDLAAFAERPPVTIDFLSCSVEEVSMQISAKIDETGSNVVLIDGAHTLGRGDWRELSILTQGLKQTAKLKRVPILVTTHANRKKLSGESADTGDDMAHSDSFYQDCDLALRMRVEIENRRQREAQVNVTAIREGRPCSFIIHARLAQNLEQKRVITLTEDDEDVAEVPDDGEPSTRH